MAELPRELWLLVVQYLPLHDLSSLYHAFGEENSTSDIPSICTLHATTTVIPSLLTNGHNPIDIAIGSSGIIDSFVRVVPDPYITESFSLGDNNKLEVQLSSTKSYAMPMFYPSSYGSEPIRISDCGIGFVNDTEEMYLIYRYRVASTVEDTYRRDHHHRFTIRNISGVMHLCQTVCGREPRYGGKMFQGEIPEFWFLDLPKTISVSFTLQKLDVVGAEWRGTQPWQPTSVKVAFDIPAPSKRELLRLPPSLSASNSVPGNDT